jgi:sporulation protein YlmC with PRC-barrel domain
MNTTPTQLALAALTVLGLLGPAGHMPAQAATPVAGGTVTVETSVIESTTLALGWSVKKNLLGKAVYNGAGQKVGKVEDLIIAPDKAVSYVIVGAGGFIGIGRHDVAVPVSQIQDTAGKLVMAGATKETIKAMHGFTYATDTSKRDAFVAAAEQDIARGRVAAVNLEKKASAATAGAQVQMASDLAALQLDLKSTEARLTELKQETAQRWRTFEAEVSAATSRLRKSTDKANG